MFPDKVKKIYKYRDISYDPLLIDRKLVIESNNKLKELIILRNAVIDNQGDVSPEGKNQAIIDASRAEIELARISIIVFSLPQETLMADALEYLYDFLRWIEGKDERVES